MAQDEKASGRTCYPNLPETVTKLENTGGGVVYLVGTAHFSEESQRDVAKTIQTVHPNIVMLELCASRVSILSYDEESLLREAKDINFNKVKMAVNQLGMLQGILHILLLTMSAHITKQLGMAPGGEFRTASREANKLGCEVVLGDRAIQITMKRAISALTLTQKVRLVWYILTCKEPISAEDIEKYKNKDMLEEVLEQMTGEFPALSKVFLDERDQMLSHCLRRLLEEHHHGSDDDDVCARLGGAEGEKVGSEGEEGLVIVGVVGIGHVPGIVKYWDKHIDVQSLLSTDMGGPSHITSAIKWSIRLAFGLITCWSCYKLARFSPYFKRLAHTISH